LNSAIEGGAIDAAAAAASAANDSFEFSTNNGKAHAMIALKTTVSATATCG